MSDRMDPATYAAFVDLRASIEVLRSAAYTFMVSAITNEPRKDWMRLADEFAHRVGNRPLPEDGKTSEERQLYVDISVAVEHHAKDFAADLKSLLSQIPSTADD